MNNYDFVLMLMMYRKFDRHLLQLRHLMTKTPKMCYIFWLFNTKSFKIFSETLKICEIDNNGVIVISFQRIHYFYC